MAKCTPTAWSDPNFHLPPSSPIRSLSSGNQLSFPPPPTSVLAHQRREKPRCWSKIFFNEIYLLIHIYIYIYSAFPSISYEFLINPSFRGHRFEDRFEDFFLLLSFVTLLSRESRLEKGKRTEISKSPSIDNRATAGQRRVRQTKGRGGGEKRSTWLSGSRASRSAEHKTRRAFSNPPRINT